MEFVSVAFRDFSTAAVDWTRLLGPRSLRSRFNSKRYGAGRGTAVMAAALLFDRRSSLDAAARQFVRAVKGADLRSAGRGFKPHAATFFVSVNL